MRRKLKFPYSIGLAVVVASIQIQMLHSNSLRAAKPNVLLMMADDLGFSDLGCFGSEIATPVLDSLATDGIVFSNFHTAPTCSPTRAMLLTGVDHHRAGMGNMYEFLRSAPVQIGKPGYEGFLNDSVITLAEALKMAGYKTAISGKWHLGRQLAIGQAPIGRGFDESWVLWSGWSEHFTPRPRSVFISGKRRVAYPRGQYSTDFYTDKTIEFVDSAIDDGLPFFMFTSYTAPHWPLEAPAELIAKQKGRYDAGYDDLRSRRIKGLVSKRIIRAGVPAQPSPAVRPQLQHRPAIEKLRSWAELKVDEKTYSAKLMEIHAAMIESLDQNVGRILNRLKERNQLDNTLVIFLSDNGAAPFASLPDQPGNEYENMGLPGSFVGFGPEWAQATSGPLRLMKGHATEGGTRVPAIIKLPNQRKHQLSAEFASVLDIAPTIYEIAGVSYPQVYQGRKLHSLDGETMLPYLMGRKKSIHNQDYSMGWELFGRTAFRRGKWKITWIEKPFGSSEFELFDIDTDPGETRDLRQAHPEIYAEMAAGFENYVRRNGVVIARPPHWD